MPIYDFESFRRLDDAKKEIAEGKAKRVDVQKENKDATPAHSDSEDDFRERQQERDEKKDMKEIEKNDTKEAKKKKPENVSGSHPLLHGDLQIEEEEL